MKIRFLPEFPDRHGYMMLYLMHRLRWTSAWEDGEPFDAAMLWQDATYVSVPPELASLAGSKPVLNLRCTDISKGHVERTFRQVFGYGSFVDPTTHRGPCVVKPEENAKQRGEVVDCPIAVAEPGSVYQIVLRHIEGGAHLEYRTPVILGAIPHVKVWEREPLGREITRRWLRTTIAATDEIFTSEERTQILTFATAIGLDLGEMDITRAEDGRIYIIDVNPTPFDYGIKNRNRWDFEDRERSLVELAACLERRMGALLGARATDR